MENKKNILTKLEDGVLVITINRDERRNAIDPETSAEMEEILNAAEDDMSVRAIVITGAGSRSFCSGEDLAAYDDNGTCQTIMAHGFAGITERISAKPIIAACNGTAVAGGLEIALACDIIVASEEARFGLSEVKVGFLATSGGLIRLPNVIPRKVATEMVLTGKLISAQRAYEVGLVNHVVPKNEVLEKALELAKLIAKNAPLSLKLSKQIFHVATQSSFEDAQRFCNVCWDYIEKTEDAIEGPKAFLEKREPNWKGR
ncbi:enoyl-CoA hydratase [Clostridium novyi B str. ATCC 27606]|uniref:Carnitinyl-CoA dehydratase n=2 Tax=Clostridium TaxID=1485 RepID=A0A9P2G5R6_CLOBO|nr:MULTISPECIES: enoyl-CoA hydratase-related protein [Clostridium]AYF54383.1 enoyl-CoA hydratase [Clostridium novyi]EES90411.1 carnitinyl-CoA dehydratase [Clostridium botulinum D str. 1873]KEI13747.1 enoyl-CoA hydratase [Clostridium novyi B str. ATCC 27606]MBO3441600.1 enoyl-CoA hydratase/isomerase family protein [Clostridium haemolyticum]NFV47059.1 enoyl-CoA hydratase [Clostridium botulinum]